MIVVQGGDAADMTLLEDGDTAGTALSGFISGIDNATSIASSPASPRGLNCAAVLLSVPCGFVGSLISGSALVVLVVTDDLGE